VAPAAVVAAASAADVAAAVRAAASCGLRVAVQGTGHGAQPCGDDVLLVTTGALDECTVHPDGWARVGAGVRWQQVVDACVPHGLAPLCGSSLDVGVVGYTTGGGLGPMARTFGLASDAVRAFDVVTGDGELRGRPPIASRTCSGVCAAARARSASSPPSSSTWSRSSRRTPGRSGSTAATPARCSRRGARGAPGCRSR
jgi:FAD/FMN-containing dehydrogenase